MKYWNWHRLNLFSQSNRYKINTANLTRKFTTIARWYKPLEYLNGHLATKSLLKSLQAEKPLFIWPGINGCLQIVLDSLFLDARKVLSSYYVQDDSIFPKLCKGQELNKHKSEFCLVFFSSINFFVMRSSIQEICNGYE